MRARLSLTDSQNLIEQQDPLLSPFCQVSMARKCKVLDLWIKLYSFKDILQGLGHSSSSVNRKCQSCSLTNFPNYLPLE